MDCILKIFASAEQRDIKDHRPVTAGRNLVGRGRVRTQSAITIPHQLFGGKPARPLHKTTLDLADIDRRIQGSSRIMKNIRAQNPVFTRKRVDDNLADSCPIGKIIEGAPAHACAVPVDFRRGIISR